MADERIDIEITDKVDANIERKIIGIATASDKGYSSVQRLKSALADVNSTAVSRLAAASNATTNALAREMSAQAKLTAARAGASLKDAQAALVAQKLATEQERTAAATLKAAAAADKAAAAKTREASAAAKLTGELEREANAAKRIIHDANTVTPGSGANLGIATGSRSQTAASTNDMRRTAAPIIPPEYVGETNKADEATKKLGGSAELARHNMVNLGYQLQDIVVSLQAGQNPLTVFIQQGSQIAGIASAAGVSLWAMARAAFGLIAPFLPLVAVIGAAYVGFKSFSNDLAAKHKPELEKYAASLGLTSKEMRKLGDETVGANGKLKSFDTVTITMADSWNGFVQTVKEGLNPLAAAFADKTEGIGKVWEAVTNFMYYAFVGFSASVKTLITVLWTGIANTAKIIFNVVQGVANAVAMVIQGFINTVIGGINLLSRGANGIMGALGLETAIPMLDEVNLGVKSLGDGMAQLSSYNFGEEFQNNLKGTDDTLKGIKTRWDENAVAAAKARLAAQAAAIIGNRDPKKGPKPKVDHTEENRAHALDVLNLKLDDELARMKLLKPERDIQQRYDQIEIELANKKIKLNDTEKASIMGKLKAVEAYKFVQAESDRILEASIGPLRTYNAAVQASAELLAKKAISSAQAAQQDLLATRAYREATEPLFAMNEELDKQTRALGLYGTAVEKNNVAEQIRADFLAKGIDLTKNATAADLAAAAAATAKANANLAAQFIQTQVGEVVNPILETQQILDAKTAMYAEIDRLRAKNDLTEAQSQQARYALDYKFNQMRLSGYSSMFGTLASLASNGNSKLAAIGKAAAVAQATIDGYLAVQKALASAPPPLNFISAAAVAVATGAQVAGILSTNVGSYATGGQFMVDGRSGVDANNINMNVTRGERVTIETPAQQRAADGAGGSNVNVPIKVVNVTDPKDIEAALDSSAGERVVMNIIRRNPNAINGMLGK